MIDFRSILKGAAIESAILALMQRAGYHAVPTAIERLVPLLPTLDHGGYSALELPDELRLLPDLLVIPETGPAQAIEVKYRATFSREVMRQLHAKLRTQAVVHPEVVTILVRGTAPTGSAGRADDHVRVLPPRRLDLIAAAELLYHHPTSAGAAEATRLEPLWEALQPMTEAFVRMRAIQSDMEHIAPLARALVEL